MVNTFNLTSMVKRHYGMHVSSIEIQHRILILLLLTSCSHINNKTDEPTGQRNNNNIHVITKIKIIDYKSDTYKISIGEDYRISERVVDWTWAALNDDDDRIDSTGKDAFICLSEPLLRYNNGEWLPSLHIKTDKNIITAFTCSVLFNLEDNVLNAEENFLRLLSNDIKRLRDDEIKSVLKSKEIFVFTQDGFVEIFELKKTEELGYDRFEYTIKLKTEK